MSLIVSLVIGMMLIGAAGAETYVVDDDVGPWATHQTIQDAIDDAADGDTIEVYDGTYNENVIVNKSVTIVGNGSMTTTVDGGGSGNVFGVSVTNVTIMGLNVTNGDTGINFTGGGAWDSNGRVEGCVITGNNNTGLHIADLSKFVAYDNHVSYNGDGIWVNGSAYVDIIANWIYNNNGSGGVWNDGIRFNQDCDNNTVENNVIYWQQYGIDLYIGTFWDHVIRNNMIYGHSEDGICAEVLNGVGTRGTDIHNNDIYENYRGIYLSECNGTDVYLNDIHNNTSIGIETYDCLYLEVFNNSLYYNYIGIQTYSDWGTNITFNEIFANTGFGVDLDSSSACYVHHNNFYNNNGSNSPQASDDASNNWDNGTEGNYWNDHNNTDDNGDGIADDPYPVEGGSRTDRYPLANRTDNDAPEQVPEFGLMVVLSSLFAIFIVAEARRNRLR